MDLESQLQDSSHASIIMDISTSNHNFIIYPSSDCNEPMDCIIDIDIDKVSREKNKDVSHLLRYVHTETLRRNYQQLKTKPESDSTSNHDSDTDPTTIVAPSTLLQRIDGFIRASETVFGYVFWFILAAISEIYQPSYIAFSIYHIIFSLYFFLPETGNINPRSMARFTVLLIGGFFIAMWIAFLTMTVLKSKDMGVNMVKLHKECKYFVCSVHSVFVLIQILWRIENVNLGFETDERGVI